MNRKKSSTKPVLGPLRYQIGLDLLYHAGDYVRQRLRDASLDGDAWRLEYYGGANAAVAEALDRLHERFRVGRQFAQLPPDARCGEVVEPRLHPTFDQVLRGWLTGTGTSEVR
jgi:hypothetical protein